MRSLIGAKDIDLAYAVEAESLRRSEAKGGVSFRTAWKVSFGEFRAVAG
ncbi:hypothetical protein [Nocardia asiatica]|nr:hypothetical protein [Nocardia asiatica]